MNSASGWLFGSEDQNSSSVMKKSVRSGDFLYGTARIETRKPKLITSSREIATRKKRYFCWKTVCNVFVPCCRKAHRKSSLQEHRKEHDDWLKSEQDRDKDTILRSLLVINGRPDHMECYQKVFTQQIARSTNVDIRLETCFDEEIDQNQIHRQNIQNPHKQSADSSGKQLLWLQNNADTFVPHNSVSDCEKDMQYMSSCSDFAVDIIPAGTNDSADNINMLVKKIEMSCVSDVSGHRFLDTGPDTATADVYIKPENSEDNYSSGSSISKFLFDEIKDHSQISQELNGSVSHQGHYFSPRQRARGNLFLPMQSKNIFRPFYNFRHFSRYPETLRSAMMRDSQYCYPTYAEEEARLNTVRNCTDPQLCGYEFQELARVGWFFNRRALVTFCCGMEMPQVPNGHPLDIHIGLSPHCEFAQSLQRTRVNVAKNKTWSNGRNEESQALPKQEIKFVVPIQATDDSHGSLSVSDDWYALSCTGNSQNVFQESTPGDHWVSDGYVTLPFSGQIGTSYMQNIVTSTTPIVTEQQQTSSTGPRQSTFTRRDMLSLRDIGQNSLANARLMSELEPDSGRRSPVFPAIDQINLNGQQGDNYRPRYPQFGFPPVRVFTFQGWPETHSQTPNMLGEAGFFYAGYGDSVLCYSCGIGIRHWLPMDDPWIEHAWWRPSCELLRAIQGQYFIDTARELRGNSRYPTYQEVKLEANRRQRAAEAGARENASGTDMPENDEFQPICKVCYSEEMAIVLMPCRHLAVCEGCSGHVRSCPICHCHVESSYRANFDS